MSFPVDSVRVICQALQPHWRSSALAHRVFGTAIVVTIVVSSFSGVIQAVTAPPQQQCLKARHAAAAKYSYCQQQALGIMSSPGPRRGLDLQATFSKCRMKYQGTWEKLRTQATGTNSTCDQERFSVADGIVTDNLTGLMWEQKTDDGSIHDKDNTYTWADVSDGFNFRDADGTVFTSFLATLNANGCFGGHCDWRLPTQAELQTILGPVPCADGECGNVALQPTFPDVYWTATAWDSDSAYIWLPSFHDGSVTPGLTDISAYARAVRGGL